MGSDLVVVSSIKTMVAISHAQAILRQQKADGSWSVLLFLFN